MEMEDHRHPPLHLQFPAAGLDLRHFISSSSSGSGGVVRPTPNPNPNQNQNQNHSSSHQYFPLHPSTIPQPQPDAPPSAASFFSPIHHRDHHGFPPPAYDMMMQLLPRGGGAGLHHSQQQPEFRPGADSSNCAAAAQPSSSSLSGGGGGGGGLEPDVMFGGGADGGTGRWPRQETLTLLDIRSRLDPKFKEANQKGPLWDEVSRIMGEEHGYQRSGKKCREKFENLYKYYKKTKEGKAGRQDGKHYRFFRQLEALYGPTESSPTSNNIFISPPSHHHSSLQIQDSHYNNMGGTTNNNTTSSSFQLHPFHNTMSGTVAPSNQDVLYSSLSISNNSSEFVSSEDSEDQDLSIAPATAVAGAGERGAEDNNNDSSERMVRRSRRRKSGWKSMIKDFIDAQMRKLIEKQEAWLEKLTRTLEHKEKERVAREEEWRKQEAARVEREQKFWAKERAWIEARDSALMEALGKLSGSNNSEGGDVQHHRDQGVNVNKPSSSSPNENDKDKEKKMSDGDCGRSSSCNYGFHGEAMYNPEGLRIHQNHEHVSNANNNRLGESSFRFLMGEGGETAVWENCGLKLSKGDDDHYQNS